MEFFEGALRLRYYLAHQQQGVPHHGRIKMGEKGTRGEYWIKHYAFIAPGSKMNGTGWEHGLDNKDRAFNPQTGQNAHWDDAKQQWIDSKTGAALSGSALEQPTR